MAQIVGSSLLELTPRENPALPVSCHRQQSTGLTVPMSQKDSLLDGVLGEKNHLVAFLAKSMCFLIESLHRASQGWLLE